MSPGNASKPPFPLPADQPKQPGQGETEPKGIKSARPYTGAKATGSPAKGAGKSVRNDPEA